MMLEAAGLGRRMGESIVIPAKAGIQLYAATV
jgi:hypothetical protein